MARAHEFTSRVRKEAYERSGGNCADCALPIDGRCEFDHVLPVGLGGKSDLNNCAVLCRKCHRHKTSTSDVPRMAKAERILEKRLGLRKSRWPMRGNKWRNAPTAAVKYHKGNGGAEPAIENTLEHTEKDADKKGDQ